MRKSICFLHKKHVQKHTLTYSAFNVEIFSFSWQHTISNRKFLFRDHRHSKKRQTFLSLSTSLPNSFNSWNKKGNIKKTCNTCNTCKTRYPGAIIQGSFLFLFVLNKKTNHTKEHAMDIEIYQYINQGTASNIAILWCKAATSLKKRSSKTFYYAVDKKQSAMNSSRYWWHGWHRLHIHWSLANSRCLSQNKQDKETCKKGTWSQETTATAGSFGPTGGDSGRRSGAFFSQTCQWNWIPHEKKCKQQSWHEIRRVTGGGIGRCVKSAAMGPGGGAWT